MGSSEATARGWHVRGEALCGTGALRCGVDHSVPAADEATETERLDGLRKAKQEERVEEEDTFQKRVAEQMDEMNEEEREQQLIEERRKRRAAIAAKHRQDKDEAAQQQDGDGDGEEAPNKVARVE